MMSITSTLFRRLCYLVCTSAALAQSLVFRETPDDIPDPWTSDPTSPPTNISFPSDGPPNPYPSGIPVLPDICDGEDPSDDCVNALTSGSGGYLYFDKDSGCSDSQKSMIETAVWDATTLANYASPFPDTFQRAHGVGAGLFYMGPDFRDQQARISGNFKRVADYKTSRTSSKAYITLSCKDPKNWCHKRMDSKSIGGYAWTVEGWLAWYHYIAFCPPFFTLDNLGEKLNFVEQELASGNTKYASQLDRLSTTGSYFLHEMMHTRIATGGIEPAIEDQPLIENFTRESGAWVYGPDMVHRLASWKTTDGGGVRRASLNADSYAMLANCLWWWDTTGYFPGLERPKRGKPQPPNDHDVAQYSSSDLPISLWIDLGNTTTPQDADSDSLLTAQLQGFQDIAYEDDDDDDSDDATTVSDTGAEISSASASAVATSEAAAPAEATPPPPPSPPAADICGDWYKFLFDHFEIYGRNFDADEFGNDGSGLKHQIKGQSMVTCRETGSFYAGPFLFCSLNLADFFILTGCGDLTGWTFKPLTDDPQGYQWYAEGDLPIGIKACVGRAVVSAGGASPDGCTGSG